MLLPEPPHAIWLCTEPVDIRKSFDGLVALVTNHLLENPASRQFFVFINRRKTHIKILYFDGSGYCIWFKRLEQGQFNFQDRGAAKVSVHFPPAYSQFPTRYSDFADYSRLEKYLK